MSYITNEDIERRLGTVAYVQLTDDAGTGSADESVVSAVRQAAEGEVDSYLARRHRVPIDVLVYPELAMVLASVTLDVAEYRLHARRPPSPEGVVARYRGALDWLAKIASGQVVLPSAREIPTNDVTGPRAQVTGNALALTREELEGL